MATTSPDNLRTPNPGDPYNLVPDLQTLAQDVQDALIARGNVFRGTAAQRAAYLSTASPGMLWQDTDGIGMLWKRGASQWVPAVWRWSGTTAQMNGFTQAPEGFEWFNTTNNSQYVRVSGVWVGNATVANLSSGTLASNSWTILSSPGNWTLVSQMQASSPWTTGIVIPTAGEYLITGSMYVAAPLYVIAGAKLNNSAANGTGLIVGSVVNGSSGLTIASYSRTMTLAAGDVITPAMYTSGTAGPYGLTATGTHISVSRV